MHARAEGRKTKSGGTKLPMVKKLHFSSPVDEFDVAGYLHDAWRLEM